MNIDKSRNVHVNFFDAVEDKEGRYWFFDNRNQSICYMYSDFEHVHFVRKLPVELKIDHFISRSIYWEEGKLLISSLDSVSLLVYDILGDHFEYYLGEENKKRNFYNIIKYGKSIIFLPYKLEESTYIFNIATCNWDRKNWIEDKYKFLGEVEYIYEENSCVYLPIINTTYIIRLELKNFSYEKISVKENINLNSVLVDGDGIWITQRDSNTIVYYSGGKYEYFTIDSFDEHVQKPFGSLLKINNKVVALSRNVDYVVLINACEKSVKMIQDMPVNHNANKDLALYAGYMVIKSRVVLFPWRRWQIYVLDVEKERLERKEPNMGIDEYYEILTQGGICEDETCTLKDYMDILIRS